MKAIIYRAFGSPEVLEQAELPDLAVPPNELVVRVMAASVNTLDSRTRRGEMFPLVNKKFPKIPGVDFSGVVLKVGSKVAEQVKHFRVGDEVFGATPSLKSGSFAGQVIVGEAAIAYKPKELSFEEAAGLPVAGLAGLYSMRELGKVTRGARVLIYGSTGGTGLLAIQLAKHLGGHVTAVCGTKGVALSREMGADLVLDYKSGPVVLTGEFDVIVDYSSHFSFEAARRYLKPDGRFVEPSPTIPRFILSMLANLFRRQKNLMLQTEAKTADLDFLAGLVVSGKLKVPIAKVLPMAQAAEAFALQEAGGAMGKVIVRIG